MVEFDSLDAATRARENLNGADIYAGCCTLKIDFAKVSLSSSTAVTIIPILLLNKYLLFLLAAREIECL